MVHLHLDVVGGIAGDMFVAAMLNTFPDLEQPTLAAIKTVNSTGGVNARISTVSDHVLTGSRFHVTNERWVMPYDQKHAGSPRHRPDHVSFRDIRRRISGSSLDEPVKQRAIAIFAILAEVEAAVHGGTTDDVRFHEVGSWDSIADIVAAAFLINEIGEATWSSSPLPIGSGRVSSQHGTLAIPAPATLGLLEGFTLYDDGIPGERITPTGAAILKHLHCAPPLGQRHRRLIKSGVGFGSRQLSGVSNILRMLVFEELPEGDVSTDEVAILAFEVDDQTAEDLAVGLESVRAVSGVLDVTQSSVVGKNGRLLTHVQVITRKDVCDAATDACFLETTTLGIRRQIVNRVILTRDFITVRKRASRVDVKVARRPNGKTSAKAELRDVAGQASGHAARETLRRIAEAAASGDMDDV
ncbi:LarC family nickel insertion protein [Pseudorhodoplanes sp.]|uniref:LarC family nickel insertion protein n=1 Tax=Pseudorhodoplanes sp. TaxID=1934341 RepID=UPI003D116F13